MSTQIVNDPNNVQLHELITESKLTQEEALALFNKGLPKPYSVSAWKAYLSDPSAVRWRRFDPQLLAHARKKFLAHARKKIKLKVAAKDEVKTPEPKAPKKKVKSK